MTDALGMVELRDDARFVDNAGRMRHLAELVDALAPAFEERTTDEWLAVLGEAGVPVGPVASIGEMLEHPQTLARDMVVEVEHAALGRVKSLGSPVKLSGARSSPSAPQGSGMGAPGGSPVPRGAPLLGEHTREILAEGGWAPEEVEGLLANGTVLAR